MRFMKVEVDVIEEGMLTKIEIRKPEKVDIWKERSYGRTMAGLILYSRWIHSHNVPQ
jgi:hypothetical protein